MDERVKTAGAISQGNRGLWELEKVSGVSWPCPLARQLETSSSSGTHSLGGLLVVRDSPEFWLKKCDHIQR